MHWILQNNLFNEAAYQVLLDTLERFELPYSIHKVIPFIGELTEPEAPVVDGPVICMGSYSLRHAAKKHGWSPGVFDLEPFHFEVQREKWGRHMLNYHSVVSRFEDAVFPFYSICSAHQKEDPECPRCAIGTVGRLAFVRPIEDSKVFAGKVFDREEFYDWKRKVCVLEHDYGNSLTKDTLVQVAHPVQIYVECRVWVVKGKIITSSIYKRGDKVIYSDEVPQCYLDYAQECIDIWQPHDAFVIDVADTPNGMRIVEINTLNSCGFYAANIQKLVMSLEEAFG